MPQADGARNFSSRDIKVRPSVGQGNWAEIPWISMLDPVIALRIDGLHLFAHEGDGFGHFCLGQSVKNQRDIELEIV